MIVPPVERWMAGETIDAATMTRRINDVMEFLLEPPQAMMEATTTQSLSTGTWTKMLFNSTVKDNDGIVDLTNDRMVIQTPGWYEIVPAIAFNSTDATNDPKGRRIVAYKINGGAGGLRGRRDQIPKRSGTDAIYTGGALNASFLNKGDYVEVFGFQDSTVSRGTVTDEEGRTYLGIRWVSN